MTTARLLYDWGKKFDNGNLSFFMEQVHFYAKPDILWGLPLSHNYW